MLNIKEILPVKLTNDTNNNIKLIKRKLNIYNLQNNTDYKIEDFGIEIIYNRWKNKTSILYYYKELNEMFDYNLLDVYKDNYLKASKYLKEILEECKVYEKKEQSDSIFLFKSDKFVLEQDLKNRRFWLSYDLIWSKFESNFGFKWLEISNLCNIILEEAFKQGGFTTTREQIISSFSLEEAFKKGAFTTSVMNRSLDKSLEQAFKKRAFTTRTLMSTELSLLEQAFKNGEFTTNYTIFN